MRRPIPRAREGAGERVEVALGPELGVEPAVVDDVVAVRAPGPRRQEGRGVEVGHPQRVEVVDQRGGVAKVKVFVELQPVGADGNSEPPS